MTTIKYIAFLAALSLGVVTLAPVMALAQGYGVGASVDANVGANSASANASSTVRLGAAETKAKDRGDQEIDRRIQALTDLNTRVQSMQKVTDTFKQSLNTAIQNQLTAFTSLKAKIDADTDVPTLKTDVQSITQSYRVFALVLPQGRIAAASDRVVTIVEMMGTLGSKLQARVQAGATAGNDVTALTAALTDMSAKLNDAQTQAQTAVNISASLVPDNGDKTVMASNTATLKQARADLTAAMKDLQAARKDATTILAGIKNFKAAATASSTTSTTP